MAAGINIDAAQWCHKAIFDEIAAKAAVCEQDIQSLWMRRYMPFTGSKKKKIRQRLQALLQQLDVLQAFSRVNVQGFSRICGKIDRKMSSGLSKLILCNYVHNMGYCKVRRLTSCLLRRCSAFALPLPQPCIATSI